MTQKSPDNKESPRNPFYESTVYHRGEPENMSALVGTEETSNWNDTAAESDASVVDEERSTGGDESESDESDPICVPWKSSHLGCRRGGKILRR